MRTKPWLWLSASWAHKLSPLFLRLMNHVGDGQPQVWKSRQWRSLLFKNPLGVAGGVDKNAEFLKAWWTLGVGFVEVGTVTPEPQKANPGKIIDRDRKKKALWNKMGFPSHGADDVYFNLKSFGPPFATPVFVNVGKNRTTPLEYAQDDYLKVMDRLQNLADVFVVNISSPNTAGLRDLQKPENLRRLLEPLVKFCRDRKNKPLLLKISPDLTKEELRDVVTTADQAGVSGFVLVNTTLARSDGLDFPAEGGVSGAPLQARSEEVLIETIKILGSRRSEHLLVSVGGIFTLRDIERRLDLGADLVQVYSALVFEGPGYFKKVAKQFHKMS